MKWNDSQTYIFVKEYLKRDHLYDTENVHYRDKSERLRGYSEISEVMNIKDFRAADVIVKIKNIRSTFCQEYKKVLKARREGRKHVPTLRWFNIYYEVFKKMKKLPQAETSAEVAETETEEPEVFIPKRPTNTFAYIPRLTDKKTISSKPRNSRDLVRRRIGNNESEFDIFARNIGAQLNAMPTMLALKAQNQIQNFLFRLRLRHMNSSRERSTSDPGEEEEEESKTEELYLEEYLEEDANTKEDETEVESKDNIIIA